MEKIYQDRPEGCIIYQNSLDVLRNMTDEQAGKVIKALADYFLEDEDYCDLDDAVRLVSIMLRKDADRSLRRYRAMCERNRRNSTRSAEGSGADNEADKGEETGGSSESVS